MTSPRATLRVSRLRWWWVVAGLAAVVVTAVLGLVLGPVPIAASDVVRELLGLPNDLTESQVAIVRDIRLPRVVLGLLVGATLSISGASYQGVFRNPLADPYLLGAAAGAGLGVTLVITRAGTVTSLPPAVPIAAFAGALIAVMATYVIGAVGGRRGSTVALIVAGVAVASFFTAVQTYEQQRSADTIQQVYNWILGQLSTAGWSDILLLLPYAAVAIIVMLLARRVLDVMAVGDDEAATLGIAAKRWRLTVVIAASLGTAAAVSVSGLIGFVGVIVPHTVRLLAGTSHRAVLPLSILFGAAFLTGTDLLARTIAAPAEIPIGVVTAFFGAPFFIVVLRTSKRFTL